MGLLTCRWLVLRLSTCWPTVYHLRWTCKLHNILSVSYWTDAVWYENVRLHQKRTTVHLKGHWGRKRVVSSTHMLHTVTFPQCNAWIGTGLGLLNGEGDETEESFCFFVLISSVGETENLLHFFFFFFCSTESTRVSFYSQLLCSSFRSPASPHYLSSPQLIASCPPSYLSFYIPSLLSVCLSPSVTVYSEQISSHQTAGWRWLMSLWVCVCVWEARRASALIYC